MMPDKFTSEVKERAVAEVILGAATMSKVAMRFRKDWSRTMRRANKRRTYSGYQTKKPPGWAAF